MKQEFYTHKNWGGKWTITKGDDAFLACLVPGHGEPEYWSLMRLIGWDYNMALPNEDLVYFKPYEEGVNSGST